jgi:hypothetical protein
MEKLIQNHLVNEKSPSEKPEGLFNPEPSARFLFQRQDAKYAKTGYKFEDPKKAAMIPGFLGVLAVKWLLSEPFNPFLFLTSTSPWFQIPF